MTWKIKTRMKIGLFRRNSPSLFLRFLRFVFASNRPVWPTWICMHANIQSNLMFFKLKLLEIHQVFHDNNNNNRTATLFAYILLSVELFRYTFKMSTFPSTWNTLRVRVCVHFFAVAVKPHRKAREILWHKVFSRSCHFFVSLSLSVAQATRSDMHQF